MLAREGIVKLFAKQNGANAQENTGAFAHLQCLRCDVEHKDLPRLSPDDLARAPMPERFCKNLSARTLLGTFLGLHIETSKKRQAQTCFFAGNVR